MFSLQIQFPVFGVVQLYPLLNAFLPSLFYPNLISRKLPKMLMENATTGQRRHIPSNKDLSFRFQPKTHKHPSTTQTIKEAFKLEIQNFSRSLSLFLLRNPTNLTQKPKIQHPILHPHSQSIDGFNTQPDTKFRIPLASKFSILRNLAKSIKKPKYNI